MEDKLEREELNPRERQMIRMRSLTNYVMGVVLIAAGFFFFFPTEATRPFIAQYDKTMITIFACVCWIYGLFRIYRGYAKNYFRNG